MFRNVIQISNKMSDKVRVFWFRRDMRFEDNVGLYHALSGDFPVLPLFIFDKHILDELPKDDARITFIHDELQKMRSYLQEHHDSSIATYHDTPENAIKQLIKDFEVEAIYTNRDYEPYAQKRDAKINALLAKNGIEFHDFKDQVIFEKTEVEKNDGGMYLVFTPYMKQWKKEFEDIDFKTYPSKDLLDKTYKNTRLPNVSLSDMGFERSSIKVPEHNLDKALLKDFEETRNIPSIEGTSRLSPYLRFGTIGYRKIIEKALSVKNETFLDELIWREFYKAILYHYPETQDRAFKPKYDRIEWRNNEEEFEKWKSGQTGYPIVDAGMRQLNETG